MSSVDLLLVDYLMGYVCSTGKDKLLETAMALHSAAMKDEYFIKRKLAPNVDFWQVSLSSENNRLVMTSDMHSHLQEVIYLLFKSIDD